MRFSSWLMTYPDREWLISIYVESQPGPTVEAAAWGERSTKPQFNLQCKHAKSFADTEKSFGSIWGILTGAQLFWIIHGLFLHCLVSPTFPPPGWYLMLSMEPILERTFFRSGVGALMGREFLGARGTGGFFSRGVCLGTGGLVMTRRRCVVSPLVEAAGVAGVVVETGRRAAESYV